MFSVIVPLYNKELSILNTIQSVLNQSFQEFEIIIVNDGSTDNSHEIINGIKDSRVQVFTKSNGGVSSARNYGIAKASYEWIAFLDGDDIWDVDHLLTIKECMCLFPNELLFASSFVRSNKEFKGGDICINAPYLVEDYFETSLVKHLIWTSVFVCHVNCLRLNYFDERLGIGEDLELFGRLIKKNKLVKTDKVTAIYRVEAENRSTVGKYKMDKSIFSIIDFEKMETESEKRYYKKLLQQKVKDFIVLKEYRCLLFLLRKYKTKIYF